MDEPDVLKKIADLPRDWHKAGTVTRKTLEGIFRHSVRLDHIKATAETGSGKTTLLFSHLSGDHYVFAKDDGTRSIRAVEESDLFIADHVTIVEGPTQMTLPQYSLPDELSIALIDGPHAYPFPDLEYFYFYPRIIRGGLLLVDDIQIPSITRMFDIIKACDMFELIDTIDHMAFFERTDADCIDPFKDGWWNQGYNRAHYEKMTKG